MRISIDSEELVLFIRTTSDALKCPRTRFKTMDPDEKQAIKDEENGYAVLADTLAYKIRNGELNGST